MDAHSARNEASENAALCRADTIVGWTLLAGLVLSIGTMTLGLALTLIRGGNAAKHVLPLDQLLTSLAQGKDWAVLDLGIVLLFGTPLLGILVALAQFMRQRDTIFVAISSILLVLLCAGFAVALR